jgi:hypothetical protein
MKTLALFFFLVLADNIFAAKYYVNDASLTGDVYTTAVGAAGNNGLSPALPKNTINGIVTNYVLGPNDTVFIDAGTYPNSSIVIAAGTDAGSALGNLVFKGADSSLTRVIASGAISNAVFDLTNISYVTFCDMYIETANNRQCIILDANSDNCKIFNCSFYNPVNAGFCIDFSISGASPDNNEVHHCYINAGAFGFRIKSTNASYSPDGNIVHDNTIISRTNVGPAFENNRASNTQFYRNRVKGGYAAILMDKPCTGVQFHNNYITNIISGGQGIYAPNLTGAGILFRHNSFYSDGECFMSDGAAPDFTGTIFRDNIFYSITNICVSNKSNSKFQEIDCNIYWHPGNACGKFNNTNYATLSLWKAADHDVRAAFNGDENSFEADPAYISAVVGNLDLPLSSPAVNMGCSAGIISDIYSTSRPQNLAVDIGAFEYVTPLPVNLINFQVVCQGENNLIKWITLSEKNNAYFTLEKSENGIEFSTLSIINGAGTISEIQQYEFLDYASGKYYRLKQTDFNGTFSYSELITANCSSATISISDQPDETTVTINVEAEQQAFLIVYSMAGQMIFKNDVTVNKGVNVIRLDKKNYSSGAYLLTVQTDFKTLQQKILK